MIPVAVVPARGGSKRIPGKNMRNLAGHPLIWYTLMAAKESSLFRTSNIIVISDDDQILDYASTCGVSWFRRSAASATDDAPDIGWLMEWLDHTSDCLAPLVILRPTSPFRSAETITRAWKAFTALPPWIDSLRAVRKAREHPGKMWWIADGGLSPVLLGQTAGHCQPWHSNPTQNLPIAYIQTGAIEIVRRAAIERTNTISGDKIAPFLCDGLDALDLNTEGDWVCAEALLPSFLQGQAGIVATESEVLP